MRCQAGQFKKKTGFGGQRYIDDAISLSFGAESGWRELFDDPIGIQ